MAETLESLLVKIEADTTSLRRMMASGAGEVEQFSRRTNRSLTGFERQMQSAGRTAARFATGLAAGIAAAFSARAVQDVVNYGAELEHAASRVGFTVEALQELRFAGSDFGIAANTVDMALQRWTRRLGEAASGTGELRPMLDRLGVDVRNADGSLRTSEAVLRDYADAVAALDNPNAELLAAFKAFDSEGAAFVNVLRQGSAGIDAYAGQARDLGLILSDELAADAEEASRQLDIMGQRLRTSFAQAVLENTDYINGLSDAFDAAIRAGSRFLSMLNSVGENEVDIRAQRAAGRERLSGVLNRDGDVSAGELRSAIEAAFGSDMLATMTRQFNIPTPRRGVGGGMLGMNPGEMEPVDPSVIASVRDVANELIRVETASANLNGAMSFFFGALPAMQAAAASGSTGTGGGLTQETDALDAVTEATARSVDELRRRIAATREGELAERQLLITLAGEAAVREARTAAERDGVALSVDRIQAIRAEGEAEQRLTFALEDQQAVRDRIADRARRALEAAIPPQEGFRRAVEDIRALAAEFGRLEAIEGLPAGAIQSAAIRQALDDLREAFPELASDAAFLSETLAGMGISDEEIAKIAQIGDELKDASDSARDLAGEMGKGLAGEIGAAIEQATTFGELLEGLARRASSILIANFVTDPLEDFLTSSFRRMGGQGQDGASAAARMTAAFAAGGSGASAKMTTSITGAGASAATSMGTAITTAGSAVAARIAAAMSTGGGGAGGGFWGSIFRGIVGLTGGGGVSEGVQSAGAPILSVPSLNVAPPSASGVSVLIGPIDARGASADGVAALNTKLDEMKAEIPVTVAKVLREQARRSVPFNRGA